MEYIQSIRSPAVKDGLLSWCEGDVFDFYLKLTLRSLGSEIADHTGYSYEAVFFDKSGKEVAVFTQDGDASKTFTLAFDAGTTAHFPAGKYHYDVYVICPGGGRVTVANDQPAIVK